MDQIDFSDFAKVEIRVGQVKAAVVPEGSEKVVKLTVNFGEPPKGLGERTIFAGIKKWYEPETLVGKQLPFILNIPFKRMGNLGESQGMLLAVIDADENGEEQPVLLIPERQVKPGSQTR